MSREFPDDPDVDEESRGADESPETGQPSVLPTPPRMLFVAALFGGMAGFALGPMLEGTGRTAMHVPWTAPAALALAAVVIAVMARRMHRLVHVDRTPVNPERGLYSLVLGKSAALVGSAVAGGYLVFGLSFVTRIEADAAMGRVVNSGLSALAAAGLCLAGWMLEKACRIPGDPEDDEDPERGPSAP